MKLPRLKEGATVVVDVEASGLHPDDGARLSCVGLAWKGGSLALPFDQGVRDKLPTYQLSLLESEADPNLGKKDWDRLLRWLSERELVMHNAKYDLTMLATGTRHWEGTDLSEQLAWDTSVAGKIAEPLESAGLDNMARRWGVAGKKGGDAVAAWLQAAKQPKGRYDLVPWETIEPYVLQDAKTTWDLYRAQLTGHDWEGEDGWRLQLEHLLAKTLYRIERRGIGYDCQRSLEAAKVLRQEILRVAADLPFEPTVPGAKKWFYGVQALKPDRVTAKGAPSLDEQQVKEWEKQGVEWAAEYRQVTKMARMLSMWYEGYPEKIGADGRLRCNYNQLRTVSSRFSVNRVQLQAVPKDGKLLQVEGVPPVRALIRAAEGRELWNLDLSQAELRVATRFARCDRMWGMLADGMDIHGETCKAVLGADPSDPDWKAKRDVAKRLTFASIFQVGAQTFQASLHKDSDVRMSLSECDLLVQNWRQTYPEFSRAYYRAEAKAKRDGWVRLLPNTEAEIRSWFGPDDDFHSGWSRMVQGSVAEAMKQWLVRIEQAWPGLLVLTVHDSVVLECGAGEGEKIAAAVAQVGEDLFTRLLLGEDSEVRMLVDAERWEA